MGIFPAPERKQIAIAEVAARCPPSSSLSLSGRGVLADDPPSVNDARNPTEDGETNVDEEVGVAASLEEDRERRLYLKSV